MANKNCSACDDLRQSAPNFTLNGLTDTEIASLKNNTGLNPSNSNDDCTDLNNMNDCMIGNMETEVDSYDVCDWRTYMKKHIYNLWTVLKAIIASICGLWTNIKDILAKLKKHDCEIDYLFNGVSFDVGEESTDGSYVVAGKGVSFLSTGTTEHSSQIRLLYIGGALARLQGSLRFYQDDFVDDAACVNFDNGSTESTSKNRKGNPIWQNNTGITKVMPKGGELLYEVRILRTQYPYVRSLFSGSGHPTGGGAYQVNFAVFSPGEWAYGQTGQCDEKTGVKEDPSFSDGHKVPDDYIYVQARMVNISYMNANGNQYSPRGYLGIRIRQNDIPC